MRDPEITHRIMASIKSKNTKPELMLRRALWNRGFRFRVNYGKLPGTPDIVFTRAKIAIFCDGDFWHGHNWALRGLSSLEEELDGYSDFWKEKILRNIERDQKNTAKLEEEGWTVLRFWESDIRKELKTCISCIEKQYKVKMLNQIGGHRNGD